MDNRQREYQLYIAGLIGKYCRGEATEEDVCEIDRWYAMADEAEQVDLTQGMSAADRSGLRQKLLNNIREGLRGNGGVTTIKLVQRKPLRWLPYAAAMLISAIAVSWFFVEKGIRGDAQRSDMSEIYPGGTRATLTLADGTKIDLSEAQAGITIANGITYLDGSAVLGESMNNGAQVEYGPHTNHRLHTLALATPKGGTYQVILPDGSKVWLNAASTLRYTAQFNPEERVVELVGEAFFDIFHTPGKPIPFRVISAHQEVEVFGTAFNISAYPDEETIQTTLVSGSVAVGVNGSTLRKTLKPGEQSVFDGQTFSIATVDPDEDGAWRDGRFAFSGTPMAQCLKQIERWYDVDFVVGTDIGEIKMWGYLSRDVMLSEILRAASLNTPLQFKREGRRIMVVRK